jgi:hypothetical protein
MLPIPPTGPCETGKSRGAAKLWPSLVPLGEPAFFVTWYQSVAKKFHDAGDRSA